MRFVVVALFAFAVAGCLEVDSPDGALACSTIPKRACPEGFYCLASSNTCWRDGHFPGDMADPTSWMFGTPDDMSIPNTSDDLSSDDSGVGDDLSPPADLSNTD